MTSLPRHDHRTHIVEMGRKHISNAAAVQALREMALFFEMDEVPLRPQAYEKAAYAVTALDRPLAGIYAESGKKALDALPGIGKGIADMLETGKISDRFASRAPPGESSTETLTATAASASSNDCSRLRSPAAVPDACSAAGSSPTSTACGPAPQRSISAAHLDTATGE